MKKIAAILTLFLVLISCSKDVTFNNPGFQARKDNFNWKADITNGNITNGVLTINAYLRNELVTIKVPAPLSNVFKNNPLEYTFGITQNEPFNNSLVNFKTSLDGVDLLYNTNTEQSNGQFIITNFDFAKRKLSGTFRFNATYQGVNPAIAKNVNFQEGFIYEVIIN
jgi:hypothetical protein